MSEPKRVFRTDAEWREKLTPELFRITRQGGIEGALRGGPRASASSRLQPTVSR
jgi:hypothetical protein